MIHSNVLAVTAESQTHPLDRTGAPKTFGRLPAILLPAAIVLGVETCIVAALGHPWLPTHQILTAPIAFVAALLFFGRKQLQPSSMQTESMLRTSGATRMFAFHAAMFASTIALQSWMLHTRPAHGGFIPLTVVLWLLMLVATAVSMLTAIAPPRSLLHVARQLGPVWAYATVCAFLAIFFRAVEYLAWDAPTSLLGNRLANAAFGGVVALLGLFHNEIYADPQARILGTPGFLIHVAGTCSGIEGLGLTLVLTLSWMLYERRRLRLARAIWLAPLALGMMWCLNLVRLTALIMIGSAGYPKLALTGFHTEAGWIAFTLVAMGFLTAASRMAFFRAVVPDGLETIAESSPQSRSAATLSDLPAPADELASPMIYLLPFIAILATSLLTRAASTGFEALYPLRLVVAAVVFWALRKPLLQMTWRVAWVDVAAGALIGVVWLIAARHASASVIATGLAGMSVPARVLWLVTRTIAAVVTVPLAEELAFRGYLARRVASQSSADPDAFDAVPYASLGLLSIVVSSLAFGAMHGNMWLLGTVAGVLFAALARRRNSLGAAVAAHAIANLVLAAAALVGGKYGLW